MVSVVSEVSVGDSPTASIASFSRPSSKLGVVARSAIVLSFMLACTVTHADKPGENKTDDRAGSSATAPTATASTDYKARYALNCVACHGADGRSDVETIPVLSGQHSFYVITQLFLFKEGRRANQEMTAVAETMSNEDMQGFASYIATLPPVLPPQSESVDQERMSRGKELAQQYKCSFCHGADFSGGEQVPRIGGQHETYLQTTLREFKDGERRGYTMAMAGAVSEISQEDLDTVAYYLARLTD